MEIVKRFMNFDKLIGTVIVKIMYWLGIVGIALACLFFIFNQFGMMQYDFSGALGNVVIGLIALPIGIVFWRLLCELYISIFKIANDLHDIKTGGGTLPPKA